MATHEDVYEIFKDFYGEEYVDLQSDTEGTYAILVHFPKVTVKNEYGDSIDITHLYAKITLTTQGTIIGTFKLNRTEYTEEQWRVGYKHSHVSVINRTSASDFSTPCLGRGPLNGTIATLTTEYNENLWRLFAYELSKYVTVESIAGGPYIRITNVKMRSRNSNSKPYIKTLINISAVPNFRFDILDNFIKHIIEQDKYRLYYVEDEIRYAYSDYELILRLSNDFIKWNKLSGYNYSYSLLNTVCILDKYECNPEIKALYKESNSLNESRSIPTEPINLFVFKGVMQTLNIIRDNNMNNEVTVLTPYALTYIYNNIIGLINFSYDKSSIFNSSDRLHQKPSKTIRVL